VRAQETPPRELPQGNSPKGTPPKPSRYSEEFERFWRAYPSRNGRKNGKRAAFDLWRRIAADDRDLLVAAAEKYAASLTAKRGFARDPERFLKREWWRDWVDVGESPGAAMNEREMRSAINLESWAEKMSCGDQPM
jgi:hypothetical protein